MNDAEHTDWLRNVISDSTISDSLKDNAPLHDGEEVFAELRRWLVNEKQREHAQGSVRGSGTPAEIAERIAELPHGQLIVLNHLVSTSVTWTPHAPKRSIQKGAQK